MRKKWGAENVSGLLILFFVIGNSRSSYLVRGGALAFKWNDPIFRSKLLNYTYGSKNLPFWLVTLLSLIDCMVLHYYWYPKY